MRTRLAVSAAVLVVGCGGSSPPPRHVVLHVSPPRGLVDAAVTATLSGLQAGDRVSVSASAEDQRGVEWTASATVRADGRGRGRLDAGRLLALMRPRGRGAFSFLRPGATTVRLTASEGGRRVATTTLVRTFVAPAVHGRELTVRETGIAGDFFTAPGGRGPPVLAIGGSDGARPTALAALLAAHGHPALALSYFQAPGLPRELLRVRLEYFERALRWLAARTRARRVELVGVSRGGEGVLIIASRFPALVSAVEALVPSSQVGASPTRPNAPAWTYGGRPVPMYAPIPVERIRGPVLTASGGEDAIWPSADYTTQIQDRLTEHRFRFAHPDLRYPAAGHGVGGAIPYVPGPDQAHVGGTPAADADARADLWPRLLRFLDGQSSVQRHA